MVAVASESGTASPNSLSNKEDNTLLRMSIKEAVFLWKDRKSHSRTNTTMASLSRTTSSKALSKILSVESIAGQVVSASWVGGPGPNSFHIVEDGTILLQLSGHYYKLKPSAHVEEGTIKAEDGKDYRSLVFNATHGGQHIIPDDSHIVLKGVGTMKLAQHEITIDEEDDSIEMDGKQYEDGDQIFVDGRSATVRFIS